MLKELEERIEAYKTQVEQSIANHNFLVGAYNEAKAVLELYHRVHDIAPEVFDSVPVVNDLVDVAEEVLDVVQPAE